MRKINIHSRGSWPSSALSNFAPHSFEFRGIRFRCIEALLQSLKFKDLDQQKAVFRMNPRQAKKAGKKNPWQESQTLWWQGKPIDRHSKEYQQFLDEAFNALFSQCEAAREALIATGDSILDHRIGKDDPKETVLTRTEFVSRLTRIRATLLQEV